MFTVKKGLDLKETSSCLIVGLFQETKDFTGILKELDDQFEGQLTELVKSEEIRPKVKDISSIYTLGKIGAKRLYIVGLGKEAKLSAQTLRETFGKAFKTIKVAQMTDVAIALHTFATEKMNEVDVAQLVSESFAMATYEFSGYKKKSIDVEKQVRNIVVYSETDLSDEVSAALEVGYISGNAVNSARTLVNLPGNMLTATQLAEAAQEVANTYGLGIEILEKEEMEELGMGALLAVNKGSVERPKMIVLKHQGKEEWTDVVGLVGKGVTYDTGGYSLKPRTGMVGMRSDMGGAAAVLGAMEIIGARKLKQNVVAVIPATDNMINGEALKPDDVIVSMSGKTIEVLNTDAEGRLVLADAMTYAKQQGADYLVDVATLTGGVIVALGDDTTGVLTNHEELFEQVLVASFEAGEDMWRLPLFEKDKQRVRNSKIADLNNSPGRAGHAIMGGAFVGEFAGDTPWVHLDIAGTATTAQAHDLGESGATGVMTRTLAKFIEGFEPL